MPLCTRRVRAVIMTANAASAISSGNIRTLVVNAATMTTRATRSSTTATVRMQARRLSGKRRPTIATMPSANAVSMDIAVPQPLIEEGERLIANEMAPRVHNSGHWTIEGAETSQFENHLRAILGLPLGSADARGPCAMLNIIGEPPETNAVLAQAGAHLHLYGKKPRPGRKIGHITVCATTMSEVYEGVERLRRMH